jgi:hypothetical protein
MSEQSGDPKSKALPPVAVSRAMLAMAPGRNKLSLIFDSPDPRAFVRRLPAEDLYFALREIGLTDAADVVGLASPMQFRAFVDLDAWDHHLPSPNIILHWLRLAREGASHNGEFRQKRAALDHELIALTLKSQTIVHSLEENDDPIIVSDNFLNTAEGKYIIEITAEGDEGVITRQMLEDFIDENPFQATRMFESVRWEYQSEMEETALRWRTGRLRDMGFPTFEEAIRIWSPLPAAWKPNASAADVGIVSGVPALLLATSRAPLLLDRVAEQLADDARPLFNEGLIYLLNCAIVSDGIEPKELDLARRTLAAARDLLSLGLELVSDGNEELALQVLSHTAPVELFRFAVTRVAALSKQATAAAKLVTLGQVAKTVLDSPDEELLVGLRKRRPRLYDPTAKEAQHPGGEWRALRDRHDIATAEAAVMRARAAGEALTALNLDPVTATKLAEDAGRALTAVTTSQLLLTAAVCAPGAVHPLSSAETTKLCGLFEHAKLTAAARERFALLFGDIQARLSVEVRDAFAVLVTRAILRFEDELGPPCAAGGIDPRFVECVLIEPAATAL